MVLFQGSHMLKKYLNIEDSLEKSLKIKFASKSTWKALQGIDFTTYRRKIVMPLFGAAYAAQNKDTPILYLFTETNIPSNRF